MDREDERRRLERDLRGAYSAARLLARRQERLIGWMAGGLVLACMCLSLLTNSSPLDDELGKWGIGLGIFVSTVAGFRWNHVRDLCCDQREVCDKLRGQVEQRGFEVSADGSVGYPKPLP